MTFPWVNYYTEFADRLLAFKNRRSELLELLHAVFSGLKIKDPFTESSEPMEDICPFTVFGCFNKGLTDQNRIAIMSAIGEKMGMQAEAPHDLTGIPVLNNMHSWFFWSKADRKPDDIDHLWEMFDVALRYAETGSETDKSHFISCYDTVLPQNGVRWNITMGLFWVRPISFLNLDGCNRDYLLNAKSQMRDTVLAITDLKQVPDGTTYLKLVDACTARFDEQESPNHSFPELSAAAFSETKGNDHKDGNDRVSTANFLKWFAPLLNALKKLGGSGTPEQARQQIAADHQLPDSVLNERRGKTDVKKFDNEVAFARNYLNYEGYIDSPSRGIWRLTEKGQTSPMNEQIASAIFLKWVDILKERRGGADNVEERTNETHYWLYAPGEKAFLWDEFYAQGIMGLGWDEMNDLTGYKSRAEIKQALQELKHSDSDFRNDTLALWQFANIMLPGDIVYAKLGRHKILGRGTVEGAYVFDAARSTYRHIRQVKWTHHGEWDYPDGNTGIKTLTDITSYLDDVQKLESLFADDSVDDAVEDPPVQEYDTYTEQNFLHDVFLDATQYEQLSELLRWNKNVILQGAPGVGKTFAAKRLAYSMMGEADINRVTMIQFHQSYSYEDFIMGYRPTKDGFTLMPGPFYEFCKKAQDDPDRDYFFIIDEINRGNLSKIFGDLLMLIEPDKRGEKLRLLYAKELFSVPANLYIIGMMNTADRSLAMIDYALRRRFAFFDLKPAFDSDGFQSILEETGNPRFVALVEQVKLLNTAISEDESLGDGFCIGHSYFCPKGEANKAWLSSVVEYAIIPLLKEYWFDAHEKADDWAARLRGALHD